jgi:hypothetical protein
MREKNKKNEENTDWRRSDDKGGRKKEWKGNRVGIHQYGFEKIEFQRSKYRVRIFPEPSVDDTSERRKTGGTLRCRHPVSVVSPSEYNYRYKIL